VSDLSGASTHAGTWTPAPAPASSGTSTCTRTLSRTPPAWPGSPPTTGRSTNGSTPSGWTLRRGSNRRVPSLSAGQWLTIDESVKDQPKQLSIISRNTVRHQPTARCQVSAEVIHFGQWGGWGSNPRPADYESTPDRPASAAQSISAVQVWCAVFPVRLSPAGSLEFSSGAVAANDQGRRLRLFGRRHQGTRVLRVKERHRAFCGVVDSGMAAPPATVGASAGHLACPRFCHTAEVDRVLSTLACTGITCPACRDVGQVIDRPQHGGLISVTTTRRDDKGAGTR
jgi:hypothetical protein